MTYVSSFIVTCFINLLFLNTVSGQSQSIVNVQTISDGGIFNITCDANRVTFPPEDSAFTRILYLKIGVNSTEFPDKTVAQYFPTDPDPKSNIKDSAARNWAIEFSGGNGTSNRNTMRIEILVRDAKCTDAGFYTCTVQYFTQTFDTKPASKTQNMTAEAAIKEPVLTLVPLKNGNEGQNYSIYQLNETLTMTCRVDGPENLFIKWRREVRPAAGIQVPYEDYPYQNDITTTAPTPVEGTSACKQYRHISTLEFAVSELDKKRVYLCAVQVNNVDVVTAGATIDQEEGETATEAQPSTAGNKPDIGLIVGVVVGCGIAIIIAIVIGVVCYRRRSKGSSNKDDADRPGTDRHEPYAVSTNDRRQQQYGGDNAGRDRKIHTGRTNDALDTSYDKGPPVYAITNNNGPRQKDMNRGRENTGYAEEDRQPRQDPHYYNYEDGPRARRYSTEDGTDYRTVDFGDPNMGTGV